MIAEKSYDANPSIGEPIDSSCQGIKDCLLLLMMVVLIELQSILTEDTFFQEWKLKITALKLMEEIFMIS